MKEKCIIFARCSTESQDIEQQTAELYKAAQKCGFTRSNIIEISDKESGVCLSFEEREGISELLHTIETENVARIIIYEISRLARRADVFYKVRDILIEKHIQLQVLTPGFEMLKSDGTIDENSNLLIGIFLSMAESEGRVRKARLARGKAKAREEGRWLGGTPPFGYKLQNHRIVIDDNAHIVKRIFNMYVQDQHSAGSIASELRSEGVLNHKSHYYSVQFVLRALKNERYTGTGEYPQIISNELWEKVKAKRTAFNFNSRQTESTSTALAKHIYKSEDGYNYICQAKLGKYEVTIHRYSIRLDFADKFAWKVTKEFIERNKVQENMSERITRQIQLLHRKIHTLNNNIDEENKKMERLEERYIDGAISKDKLNKLESKIKLAIKSLNKELKELYEELHQNEENLNNTNKIVDIDNLSIDDKIELIHNTIKYITVERLIKYSMIFHVTYMNGEQEHYKIHTFKKTVKKSAKTLINRHLETQL